MFLLPGVHRNDRADARPQATTTDFGRILQWGNFMPCSTAPLAPLHHQHRYPDPGDSRCRRVGIPVAYAPRGWGRAGRIDSHRLSTIISLRYDSAALHPVRPFGWIAHEALIVPCSRRAFTTSCAGSLLAIPSELSDAAGWTAPTSLRSDPVIVPGRTRDRSRGGVPIPLLVERILSQTPSS